MSFSLTLFLFIILFPPLCRPSTNPTFSFSFSLIQMSYPASWCSGGIQNLNGMVNWWSSLSQSPRGKLDSDLYHTGLWSKMSPRTSPGPFCMACGGGGAASGHEWVIHILQEACFRKRASQGESCWPAASSPAQNKLHPLLVWTLSCISNWPWLFSFKSRGQIPWH